MSRTVSQSKRSQLLQRLSQSGYRILRADLAREFLPEASSVHINQMLHHLTQNGWLMRLRRGLYALSPDVFQGPPIHEYELAMALVEPAAISHWSALSVHGLTEQLPREVVVLTTSDVSIPRDSSGDGLVEAGGHNFRFCRVIPEHYFGFQTVWRGEALISVTDPERTLLDGLCRPQLCGDWGGVLEAFEQHLGGLQLERICEYAPRLGIATAKRLGWVLERLGVENPILDELAKIPIRGFRPLDASGERRGPCNSRWNIIENLPGSHR